MKRKAKGTKARATKAKATKANATTAKATKAKGAAPKRAESSPVGDAGARIDERIATLGDWRGAMLAQVRGILRAAVADLVEEWKWDVPVWSCGGIVCTGETYKAVVKLTFARGAALPDPRRLFNSSLGGNTRRAIDLREGDRIDAAALQALVRAAVAENRARSRRG